MSEFVVSARKYRPQTFDTVVGQQSITNTLKNAIKNDHLAQAFLFCGSRGVGKTTTARILAKTLNCFNRSEHIEACDQCDSCQSFNTGASLNIYELDAASNNSVDDIRSLIDQVRIAPQLGDHKVYIIDEVHMLSASAFNAFLKTLEEPPKHAVFILATTEKHKIIPTILSRCQIFDFQRIKVKDIANHLAVVATKEGITADPEALFLIAQKADGALRDALSIFDQIVTFSGNNIQYQHVVSNLNILDYDYYFKFVEHALKEDITSSLILFNEIVSKGFDIHNFLVGLSEHFRNLLICKDEKSIALIEVGDLVQQKFIEQSKELNQHFILRALTLLNKADVEFKSAKNQRLLVEISLMQLCSLKSESEKKKSLTESIDILPFSGQSLRPEKPITQKVIPVQKPIQQNTSFSAKVPSNLEKPTGNFNGSHPSIKELLSPTNEENITISTENSPREFFTEDQLKIAWKQYSFVLKEQGLGTFYNALIKRNPLRKDDETYIIQLDSQIQKDYILDHFEGFITFLRKQLRNFHLSIEIEIIENQDETKFLTSKQKFELMARKNPNLHVFKSLFNLDIEY